MALAASRCALAALGHLGGGMTCLKKPSSQGSLTSAQVARYLRAKERFNASMQSSLSNGAPDARPTSRQAPSAASSSADASGGLRPIGSSSHDLLERLAYLATAERGDNAPPLTTYRTTSTEHGEVYQASSEYIAWLRRTFPGYGEPSESNRPVSRGPAPRTGDAGMTPIDF